MGNKISHIDFAKSECAAGGCEYTGEFTDDERNSMIHSDLSYVYFTGGVYNIENRSLYMTSEAVMTALHTLAVANGTLGQSNHVEVYRSGIICDRFPLDS